MYLPLNDGWRIVVFAAETRPNGNCPVCVDQDYADCPCPGPTMDDHEYEEFDGVLYARPMPEEFA